MRDVGDMSGPRSHRGLKARLFVYGILACVVVGVVYVFRAGQSDLHHLRKCRDDHLAVSAQLRSVVEYKDRMESALASVRSLYAETVSTFRVKENEYEEMSKRHATIQKSYHDLGDECEKIKTSAKNDQKSLDTCETERKDSAKRVQDAHRRYEETVLELENVRKLNRELTEKIQQYNQQGNVVPRSRVSSPVIDSNKYLTKQVKIDRDVYNVSLSTDIQNRDASEVKGPLHNVNEIPQGVAPEIFVEEQLSKKQQAVKIAAQESKISLLKPEKKENLFADINEMVGNDIIEIKDAKKERDNEVNLSHNNPEHMEHDDNREDDDIEDYGNHNNDGEDSNLNL